MSTDTATVPDGRPPDAGPDTTEADTAAALERRHRGLGIVFLLAAGVMFWAFGLGSEAGTTSRFVLDSGNAVSVPDLRLPSRNTVMVLALVCAVLGGIQLAKGFGRRAYAVLGVVAALFVVALLAWASSGASFNLTGMLQLALTRATPLILGGLAGLLCEKSGVVNIAIEGMMLSSAFMGALIASAASNLYIGLGGALLTGALLGAVLAVLSIRYRVDQIIGGTVINIFALGMTSYLANRLAAYPDLNNSGVFANIKIPLLSQIPVVGPVLFDNNIYVYAALVLVALLTWTYASTRWGLRVRSVGEHPRAADTVGIDVHRTRFRSVVLGGMCASLAGSFLTLGSLGSFQENMTAGRGFIALAALIFGRWKPTGVLAAALLFGFAEALQFKLSGLSTPIPSQFLLMAPYVLTLLVVAGVVGRSSPPAADGQPY